MSDISMCSGEGCPLKKKCHRHTATSGYWQSYFTEVPYNKENKVCDYFWSNKISSEKYEDNQKNKV